MAVAFVPGLAAASDEAKAEPGPLRIASARTETDRASGLEAESQPRAVATFEGIPARGLAITLDASGSTGRGLSYRWVQIGGKPVEIADANRAQARVMMPDDATATAFLLIVANPSGLDCATVSVPRPQDSSSPSDPTLKADAGDDQIGLVGRQITLNAMRSEPRGKIGYRWLQVAGPAVAIKIVDRHTYTFVPQEPGIYRFALVVASGSEISEPDAVEVAVGPGAAVVGREQAPVAAPPSVRDLATSLLLAVNGGPAKAADLAGSFDGIAERMDLYESFAEAFSEMAKRLETVLPAGSPARPLWDAHLFTPLTSRLALELRPEGLDLARPDSMAAAMTATQKQKLAGLLREMAAGFRRTQTVKDTH
jgi:hypothetical protein